MVNDLKICWYLVPFLLAACASSPPIVAAPSAPDPGGPSLVAAGHGLTVMMLPCSDAGPTGN